MLLRIFSVHDSKAKAFLPPFFLPEVGMAIRTFSDCVNNRTEGADHAFSIHPEDYTLFEIGQFDNSTGKINIDDANISHGSGVQHLEEIIL